MKAENIGSDKGKHFNINVAWETGFVVDEENRSNNT
jgi:hypothetical protein